MKYHLLRNLIISGSALTLSACATQSLKHVSDDARYDALTSEKLAPFDSEDAYRKWLRDNERLEAKRRKAIQALRGDEDDLVVVTGSKRAAPNITNVQNIGVDEGDIVKQVGDHLVLMQDGRLFSLDIGGPAPTLAARIDIYDEIGEGIWYDELLVSGRRLVVTGYNYDKDATEISVFDLDRNGQFSRQGTWYLGSEDYYSGDNSATRMIGDTLIFHTQKDDGDPSNFPILRRKGQDQGQAILRTDQIHPPLLRLSDPELHMVTECKVSQELTCNTRAVMAAYDAEWIVTEESGFLWVAAPRLSWYLSRKLGPQKNTPPATIYRFPLGTNEVDAVTLDAKLNSRFAFEVRNDSVLALVQSNATDDDLQKIALVDIPVSEFSAQPIQLSSAYFKPLPSENAYLRHMRFTANDLIYADYSDEDDEDVVYTLDLDTHLVQGPISVPHDIDRLDRVGSNAVLIGEASDSLDLSWLDLSSASTLTDTLSLPNRYEAEGRAQALNMRVDENGSALLGLPTYTDYEGPDGWVYDEEDGTDISFARVSSFGQLTSLGSAKGDPSRVNPNYECETSCVDWYGNARPFFIGDRIFALIASELIELQETPNGLVEVSRVNLSAPL